MTGAERGKSAVDWAGRGHRATPSAGVSWTGAGRVALAALAAAAVAAACSAAPARDPRADGLPYPSGCAAFGLSDARCARIVATLGASAGAAPGDPATLFGPDCGPGVLCAETQFSIRVRFTLAGGRTVDRSLECGVGDEHSALCADDPTIRIGSPTMDGNRDVPCGADGASCASPLPSPDPAALRAAVPLRVASLDVPIDHAGHYDVLVGTAALPDGLLSTAAFSLADPAPDDLSTTAPGVFLDVVSLDGGGSFSNAYAHGWRPGIEHVEVRLRFDVASFSPGAVLRVRGIAVD